LFADALALALAAAEFTDGDVDPTCGQSLVRLGYDRDFAETREHTGPLRQPPSPAGGWRSVDLDRDRREVTVELAPGPVLVRVSRDDLMACVDILLENVFAHTPEGVAFTIRLSRRAGGGAWLVVADDGPGFGDVDPTQRGLSRGGSTGLGLDIARRIAEGSGGSLVTGRSASGGGAVTLGLGSPARPPETGRKHGRRRLRLRPDPDAPARATARPGR